VSGTPPRISVVIPVHCRTPEHRRYLEEALDSAARQTFRDFEVVLVDDCSPLDIGPLTAAAGLPEARVLRQETNLGHARSRNRGVQAARGDLIAFLDHDDLWLPEKLARQLAVMEAHPEVGLVFCAVELFGPLADRFPVRPGYIPTRPDFAWFACRPNYVITASAVLAQKRVLTAAGLFDPRYSSADDFDLWLKAARLAPLYYLPEKLVRYRLHAANVNYAADLLNDNRLLTRLLWRAFLQSPFTERLKLLPALARKLAGRVRLLLL